MKNKKRLLVTGANGFVSGSILTQAASEWEIHAVSRGPEPKGFASAGFQRTGKGSGESLLCRWHHIDPLLLRDLTPLFRQIRPDALIHTAALADIDFCQAQPELARAVNVEMTRSLAKLCVETKTRFVFCSTDTIFDGENAPYKEDDPPGPVNLYAMTKVEAEQIVSGLGQGVIARLSLVVGLPVLGAGNSFLARMIAAFKEERPVGGLESEIRTPLDVITAGRALLELAAGNHRGIFHLAGHTRTNRFELARAIAARFGFRQELVFKQSPADLANRAPRPRDASLDNRKVCATLKTPMLSLDQALTLILQKHDVPARLWS